MRTITTNIYKFDELIMNNKKLDLTDWHKHPDAFVTRDGLKAGIYWVGDPEYCAAHPMVCVNGYVIEDGRRVVRTWHLNGSYSQSGTLAQFDLFNAPVEEVTYVNVYQNMKNPRLLDSVINDDLQKAIDHKSSDCLGTIKLTRIDGKLVSVELMKEDGE